MGSFQPHSNATGVLWRVGTPGKLSNSHPPFSYLYGQRDAGDGSSPTRSLFFLSSLSDEQRSDHSPTCEQRNIAETNEDEQESIGAPDEAFLRTTEELFSCHHAGFAFVSKRSEPRSKTRYLAYTIHDAQRSSFDRSRCSWSQFSSSTLFSTIISKQSWGFLFEFLALAHVQRLDSAWSDTLARILELKQTIPQNQYLQLSQQVQFTLPIYDRRLSAFPSLHQPYQELRKLIITCVEDPSDAQTWQPIASWIQAKSSALPVNELKAVVLLNIYYDYYCTNRLQSIETLGETLKRAFVLSREERRVFRVLMDPERYMIGYGDNAERNALNDIFKLNCHDDFDLSFRHLLVNLMAMILLGGKQSFLWTMAFEPRKLCSTFGK